MLVMGLFSKIGGTQLPGDGAMLVKIEDFSFSKPVFVGENVKAELTVTKDVKRFCFASGVVTREGEVVASGKFILTK